MSTDKRCGWQDGFAEKATHHAKAVGALGIPDGEVETFAALYNTTTRPKALDAVVRDFHLSREGKRQRDGRIVKLDRGPLNRHQAEFASLCRVARGAMAQKFAWTEGKEKVEAASREETDKRSEIFDQIDFAHSARDAIRRALAQGQESVEAQEFRPPNPSLNGHSSNYDPWDGIETSDEYGNRMMDWMTSDAADSSSGIKVKVEAKREPIFREYGPTDWAKPVGPVEFVIPGVLCEDTFGPNAGPKKSLKTHDNGALALSISTGISLYRNDVYFPLFKPGKGLYLIGEGGEKPIIRMLQRICRAYGIKLDEVMKDPAFPLILEFGAAPLDSEELRDEIKRLLDYHQPTFVLMESFYNFHPAEVNAASLYERGQVIDGYHKLVREGGENVISLLTDHYRSTNIGKSLDLDNISMAGQAENADSWILRYPVKANVRDGDFSLHVGFNSRQWGGTDWKIDWHLGQFDHEKGCHVGEISWDVASAHESAADEKDNPDKIHFNNDDEVMAHIRSQVLKNPRMSKTAHKDLIYEEVQITRVRLNALWAKSEELGFIYTKKFEREEIDPKNPNKKRTVTREIWLPGQGAVTAQEQRDTWGVVD